jgi:carbamoyltransferase
MVVGWFQGRMEFGPRALGARSILGDPRSPAMQSQMNLKIKYRESFRPFAPSVLRERVADYFELECDSPYMQLVAPVRADLRLAPTAEQEGLTGVEKLRAARSVIPAVTHVDYSARIQTVRREENPRYHELLAAFERLTGCAVLVNTSFNVRGEPIVCTPADAYRCFMRTEMDALVVGDFVLLKAEQGESAGREDAAWQEEFQLD